MNLYPRTNYEMTEEDLQMLLEACKPTICIKIGNYEGSTPQENANQAWRALGEKMGFDSDTVEPARGKGQRFFTAIPSETEQSREERESREAEERKQARINEIMAKVDELQAELKNLKQP
jgi:hypothetical protein